MDLKNIKPKGGPSLDEVNKYINKYNKDYIEQSKIVVKFECKEVGAKT